MATRRHGFINYVPNVHDTDARERAHNFFGENSLGKSNISVYRNLFIHEDSPNATNESELVKNYFADRNVHVGSLIIDSGRAYNPDFPLESFSYNYSGNKGIQKISFNRGEIESNEELQTSYLQPVEGANEKIEEKNTYTFTPSLSVTTDFNGEVLSGPPDMISISRAQADAAGGGFGSDVRFNQASDVNGVFQDVHEITDIVTEGRENSYVKPGSEGVKESYLFKSFSYDDINPSGS